MKSRFLMLFLVLLLLSGSLAAAQEESELSITEYTLDNGLDVILVEDHSAPTVAVNTWYRVGGANDPEGRSGFAHLFEHMMFQGSAHIGKGELDQLITAVGGDTPNAYTDTEITVYYLAVPSYQLPLALWAEADRMASLDVNQTNLDNQRAVVIEEYKFRVSNSPYGEAFQTLFTMPYEYEPYQKRVIGSIEDLNQASVEDVRDFHETYYLPNNATLVVAGDIDVEQTQAMIEEYFGSIPAGDEPPSLPEYEPQQQSEAETLTIEDPLINTPAWLVSYEIPPRNDEDYPALELLARILGGGFSSRLAVALLDTGLAADAGAFTIGNRGPGMFAAYVFPNMGVELSEVEQVYYDELARIEEEGIDPAELEKVINQIRSERIVGLETASGLAESIQAANFFFDDPQAVFGEIERFQSVTSEDIQRVIREYLAPEDRHVLNVMMGDEAAAADEPEPVTGATGSAEDEEVDYRYVLEQDTPPEPLPINEFTLPTIREGQLENGMQVVVIERPEVPIISLDVYLAGGLSAVPVEQAGLAELTADLLTRGTENRSAQEIASTVEQEGGFIGATAGRDSLSAGVFMLAEDTDLAFNILGDVVLNSTFPEDEFGIAQETMLTNLQSNLSDPAYVAVETFDQLLYGEHPYGGTQTEASIEGLSREDVAAYYDQQLHPENALLIVAGDVTFEEAMAQAEATFGDWAEEGEPPTVTFPEVEASAETGIYLVDRPGSSQAEFFIGNPGVEGSSAERYAISVMNEVFGGSFTSRLSANIREDKGYTYGIYSGYSLPVGLGRFGISTAVRNEVAAGALREILGEIERIQTEPVPEDELMRVKSSMTGSFALSLETYQDFVDQIASLKLRGLPISELETYLSQVEAIDSGAVQEVAGQYITPNNLLIVVVGDASAIQESLEAIAPVTLVEEAASE